jgi:hypothetical protein
MSNLGRMIQAMLGTKTRSRNYPFNRLLIAAALFASPSAAHADAGLPMLPLAYPVILVFLAPVIAIESLYIRFRLGTGWRNTLVATSKANVITLLLGFPLAWLLYLVFELVFFGALTATGVQRHLGSVGNTRIGNMLTVALSAAWMGPGIAGRWVVLLAFVVLLVPSFLVSGYVESALLGRRGWLTYKGRSTIAIWQANIFSYVFLAVAGCVLLWTQLGHG